ncbi:MAG: alanine racemase [Actinomycetota bacterium]
MGVGGGTRYRPTRVGVDLDAIRANVGILRPLGTELMAVVKANAYGHGAVQVAEAVLDAGASALGVALVEEGLALRGAGVEAPILVLSEFPAGSEAVALASRLTPTLYTGAALARLASAARGPGTSVHVKVDTGMHRVGVWPPDDVIPFVRKVVAAGFVLDGLWTHFAMSEEDADTTKGQMQRFETVVEAVRAVGQTPRVLHAANSGALLRHPETHLDLVRPGIALYGIPPAPGVGQHLGLRPALSWTSKVTMAKRLEAGERVSYGHRYVLERDAWVATLPVGYADGYPRSASSRAEVLIRGRRCRVAGNVTMDQLMVDCGDLQIETGDDAVLIGEQTDQTITAWELASNADTIAYEIVTRIGGRVPREHTG